MWKKCEHRSGKPHTICGEIVPTAHKATYCVQTEGNRICFSHPLCIENRLSVKVFGSFPLTHSANGS